MLLKLSRECFDTRECTIFYLILTRGNSVFNKHKFIICNIYTVTKVVIHLYAKIFFIICIKPKEPCKYQQIST